MANTTLTLKIDEGLKNDSQIILERFGLDFSSAFKIFLKKCVEEKKIPFDTNTKDYTGMTTKEIVERES